MRTKVGSRVHPWYKGTHEWEVKGIAELSQPIQYSDSEQGKVSYDPKILLLGSDKPGEKVLWFAYWIATSRTEGRMKWGQGPPMLEESVLIDLLKKAIRHGFFARDSLARLARELDETLRR